MKRQIILAGGSGFIGQHLSEEFVKRGYDLAVLTRSSNRQVGPVRYLQWDGRTLGDWANALDGSRAVINLTGKSINCRPTPENRRAIIESRVDSVRVLGEAVGASSEPPECFVQVSGIGIYRDSRDCCCDEAAPHGSDFEAKVCEAWESAFGKIEAPGMRKIGLRLAVALGPGGGLLAVLGRLTKWFLGGHVGDGGQFVSWIHIGDLSEMFCQAVERDDLTGVFNATSPNPVTNAKLMRELRRSLHRPWSPPVPVFAARIGSWLMGADAELALASHRCSPRRFLEQQFEFQFPEIRGALADIYKKS